MIDCFIEDFILKNNMDRIETVLFVFMSSCINRNNRVSFKLENFELQQRQSIA